MRAHHKEIANSLELDPGWGAIDLLEEVRMVAFSFVDGPGPARIVAVASRTNATAHDNVRHRRTIFFPEPCSMSIAARFKSSSSE
jgi:hypothetical protein